MHNVRHNRVLCDEPAGGIDTILHVSRRVSADIVRRAIGGPRGRRRDERAERRVPGSGHVGSVPTFLGLLRQLRRDPRLPEMDHVSELHQIRIRGNRVDRLQLRSPETQVFPGTKSMCDVEKLITSSTEKLLRKIYADSRARCVFAGLLPLQESGNDA